MRAVRVDVSGGPEALNIEKQPPPVAGEGEILINVRAAGLNRADALQRAGRYNLPPGASDILGLEVSGTIADTGEEVVALLTAGGYAEQVAVPRGQVLPAPRGISLVDAAGIPEAAATVVSNIVMTGRFQPGETVLIHGATGGVGTFAIQLVKALGGRVAVTASTEEKLEAARKLGADAVINYRTQNFADELQVLGGADIILDTVAGSYLNENLRALKTHGRMVTIGRQGGTDVPLDFALLMKKKASVTGTLLRDRPVREKEEIMKKTHELVWPLLESGQIQPVTDQVFPLSEVVAAHSYFDSKNHIGKVLLDCEA